MTSLDSSAAWPTLTNVVGLAALTVSVACSTEPADDTGGAQGGGGATSASTAAAGGNEASGGASASGGSGGDGTGGSAALPNECDATCQQTDATIDFGNGLRVIERAFYGLTGSSNEPTKLYVELSRGGGDTCPTMTSPTPERLVLIHDIAVPTSTEAATDADGITAQYFDFVGDDLPNSIQTPAQTIEITARAIDVCLECLGQAAPSDPDGFFALDLSITFDGGTASGSVYATHCDSLDTQR